MRMPLEVDRCVYVLALRWGRVALCAGIAQLVPALVRPGRVVKPVYFVLLCL